MAFMLLPGFALSHFNMFRSHVKSVVYIVHFALTPGRSRCAMDRAQISRLSLQELGQLIHLCLQEFGTQTVHVAWHFFFFFSFQVD